jgi:glutamate formiminotransferase
LCKINISNAMARKLVECVPNISEGRDAVKIKAVTDVVNTVEGVKLLDVDPGKATNRTVITFVGEPQAAVEAAFKVIKKAAEVIDMSTHSGEHPRFGATDVCPFVPVANVTMEECEELAHKLGKRIGDELGIPGYFYENAAKEEKRKNLANCRSGEYEGLQKKLTNPEWKPDFGPTEWNEQVKRTGCTAISARDFLVAYNINLNTTSTRRANAVAFDIREAGRTKTEDGTITGKKVLDQKGELVREPGKLKCVKGIGWYIEEYGIAQISYNLTNISITPVHIAFDETCNAANARGLRVTGSELIGLIPKQAMLDAADYFLKKQQRSLGINEKEKIKIAVKSLGLDDLKPFIPEQNIIEYMIDDEANSKLIDLSLIDFANETAGESPAPGGGSISAYIGALGAALATMVANLSSHKRGWDDKWEDFSNWAVKGEGIKEKLMALVDEDTNAFNQIMEAFKLPKNTDEEKAARQDAIENATKNAILVPYAIMEACYESMEVIRHMAEHGLKASASDAGVGALAAVTGMKGAFLNVRINSSGLKDKAFAEEIISKANALLEKAINEEKGIIEIVETNI